MSQTEADDETGTKTKCKSGNLELSAFSICVGDHKNGIDFFTFMSLVFHRITSYALHCNTKFRKRKLFMIHCGSLSESGIQDLLADS